MTLLATLDLLIHPATLKAAHVALLASALVILAVGVPAWLNRLADAVAHRILVRRCNRR